MDYKKAFSLLGLPTDSSLDDVEKAYKKLVPESHPDKGGSDEKMTALNEARNFLREYFSGSNLPAIIQQFGIAVRDMNAIAINQRNIERKVEKATEDVRKTATDRLKNWRQIAIVFATISAAAIFLGKDIPKDIISSFQIKEVAIPTKVDEPKEPEIVKKYYAVKPIYTLTKQSLDNLRSEGIPDDTLGSLEKIKNQELIETEKFVDLIKKMIGQEQTDKYGSLFLKYSKIPIEEKFTKEENQIIASYLKEREKYIRYRDELRYATEINRKIKERNRVYSLMWYACTFGLGMYAALIAWHFNRRIQRVELELTEFNDELLRKSSYFVLLKDLFSDEIPSTWTQKTLEDVAGEWQPQKKSWEIIHSAVGAKKFVQLVLINGQEIGFLKIAEGNEQNNYEEKYSIAESNKS